MSRQRERPVDDSDLDEFSGAIVELTDLAVEKTQGNAIVQLVAEKAREVMRTRDGRQAVLMSFVKYAYPNAMKIANRDASLFEECSHELGRGSLDIWSKWYESAKNDEQAMNDLWNRIQYLFELSCRVTMKGATGAGLESVVTSLVGSEHVRSEAAPAPGLPAVASTEESDSEPAREVEAPELNQYADETVSGDDATKPMLMSSSLLLSSLRQILPEEIDAEGMLREYLGKGDGEDIDDEDAQRLVRDAFSMMKKMDPGSVFSSLSSMGFSDYVGGRMGATPDIEERKPQPAQSQSAGWQPWDPVVMRSLGIPEPPCSGDEDRYDPDPVENHLE